MDPKWTLSLLAAILHTVASAPESVFALEGNSVTLIMQRHDNISNGTHIYDVTWVLNQSCDVVKYYPHYNESRQLRIPDPYKGRVEFDCTTFSLELTNLRKKDSGLYKGEINADGRRSADSEYRLNVLEQVTAPALTVESVSSSGDLCNVTATCRAGDLSLTSTCDISSCRQDEQTAPSSLAIFIKDGVIICNHSNPVSWDQNKVELETLCQKQEFPLGDEQTTIWIYVPVASALVLLVLILVLCGVLCFRMHSKNQVGSSPKVYQSVGRIVPTETTPEKKQSEVSAKTLSQSSDVKRCSPSKSRSPYSVVVNLLQTPSSSSVVRRRTPNSRTPSSHSVVNLSQTPSSSSDVKRRPPSKSRSRSSNVAVKLEQKY